MKSLAHSIVSALSDVLQDGPVALHEPRFNGNESLYLANCIDSTYVSSVGPYVDKLEQLLKEYTGAKNVIATVNGTSALHVALVLAGVEPGDEVLVPALSFVATAHAVRYCGATPHFLDIEERTLGLDPVAMANWLEIACQFEDGRCWNRKTGNRVAAVIPMHTFGHPCDIQGILAVASDYGLPVVEDAAESLGSFVDSQHTGTFGLLGTLSFNGNKIVTTGGGGAILTCDDDLARRAKHLTTTAKVPHGWDFIHDEVGFNYRMPNINAALGCAQMEQIDSFIDSKRNLFERYQESLSQLRSIHVFREPSGTRSNYWLQSLLICEDLQDVRDEILTALNSQGFSSRPPWKLLTSLKPYLDCSSAPIPVAKSLERRIINIPSSAGLA